MNKRRFRIKFPPFVGPPKDTLEALAYELYHDMYFTLHSPGTEYRTVNVLEGTIFTNFNEALYYRNCSSFRLLLLNTSIEEVSTPESKQGREAWAV